MTEQELLPFELRRKNCRECGDEKPLSEFHNDPRRLDGRNVRCANCVNIWRRKFRAGERRPRVTGEAGHDYVKLADDDIRIRGRTRTCRDCETEFPLSVFSRNRGSKLGRVWACPSCYAAQQECSKVKRREHNRATRRARKYGISLVEVQWLFSRQNGCCGICGAVLDPHAKETHVDHCHSTGVVRGVLCRHCNSGLGYFKDDPERLTAAIRYLRGELICRGAK